MSHDHDHSYDHSHGHDHRHDHDHDRSQGHQQPPLARGCASDQLLFLDCFSGIAGDMTVAALVDLGVPSEVVAQACSALGFGGYELRFGSSQKSQIVATSFAVEIAEGQPQRDYASIDAQIAASPLTSDVRSLAREIFKRLAVAEARCHRVAIEKVHFHEVGAIDAIVDIVGSAAAFAYLQAKEVVATPLPMGHGMIQAQHGPLPLPAPATVFCLRDVPTYPVPLEGELVTPTGAAIVATVATRFAHWFAMTPQRIGFGAGRKNWPDRPNLLRAVLATPAGERPQDEADCLVVEANIDDITGEVAAHALQRLLDAGALDAWTTAITMKKGRPALTLAALTRRHQVEHIATTLMRETTSIGVRCYPVQRQLRPRRSESVETRYGAILVKVSEGFTPIEVKAEFNDCARAARDHGVSLREVQQAALAAYHAGQAPDPSLG